MRRRFVALCLALVAASAAQADISVRDDRGRTVTLARTPARIVSLLPSLTESLCALQACDRLVGTDRFSNWPPQVQALPKLGGIEDTPFELIVKLKPDLVLAAKSHRLLDRLDALGIPVVALESQSHADVRRTLGVLGQLLDQPEAAVRAWQAIDADLQRAALRVPRALRGETVYFEVGSAPYGAGRASFIGETLDRLGLGNAIPAEMGPFPKLNPEFVVRTQPHVVMATARDAAAMRERPGWQSLAALRAGRVCAFETPQWEVLIRPGPRLGEAALVMADCLAALPAASGNAR
jgi:iron complex transport system substrate-binding protein